MTRSKLSAHEPDSIVGVILAGGQSRRFGANKAVANLDGQTLLAHVIQRIQPQVSELWLNGNDPDLSIKMEGICGHVFDASASQGKGPLAGVLAALTKANSYSEWLLVTPCDTPFLPGDLVQKLLTTTKKNKCLLCMCRYGDQLHPSVSLWHRDLLPALKKAVVIDGKEGFKQFYQDITYGEAVWSNEPVDPFTNINTQADLTAAESLLRIESN